MRSSVRVCALALALLVTSAPAGAKVFHTREEALALAFPEADRIERQSHLLDDAQKEAVEKRARAPLESRIITVWTAHRGESLLGHAVLDVHTVRTLPEAVLIALSSEGTVKSVRLVAFHEPSEYQPSTRWLRQFEGRPLDAKLRVGREIHGIAGATLSSQAVTRAVRRAQAIFAVIVAGGR